MLYIILHILMMKIVENLNTIYIHATKIAGLSIGGGKIIQSKTHINSKLLFIKV